MRLYQYDDLKKFAKDCKSYEEYMTSKFIIIKIDNDGNAEQVVEASIFNHDVKGYNTPVVIDRHRCYYKGEHKSGYFIAKVQNVLLSEFFEAALGVSLVNYIPEANDIKDFNNKMYSAANEQKIFDLRHIIF